MLHSLLPAEQRYRHILKHALLLLKKLVATLDACLNSHVLQEINVLHIEVVRAADSTNLWHDQEVAWSNRMCVLEGDDRVILVHHVGWLFLPNDTCEDVLLGI